MLAVLTLGVFLRAFRLDIFQFKADELEEILLGLAAPAQHWWIDHGSTASVGIPFGPTFSYIMGLLTSISPDPYILTAFILAINIVVLMLAVLFFAEFSADRKQFSLCVLLFSLSPYLIIFSRKIWQPNVLLLFVIPLVLMILRVRRNPRFLAPIGLLSSILVQLHHSGAVYVPLLVCYAAASLKFRGEPRPEGPLAGASANGGDNPNRAGGPSVPLWAAVGLILFILPLIPYLSFMFNYLRQPGMMQWPAGSQHYFCVQGSLKWVLFSATGNDFWQYVSSGKRSQWNWPVQPFPGAALIFCYFLVIPLVLGVYDYARTARALFRRTPAGRAGGPDPKVLLCPLSIVFLFVVYCFVLRQGRPHHYTIIVPFLILALSDGILILLGSGKSVVRVLVCAGLISYALQYPVVLSYVSANNGYIGEYGVCYREQRNAAKKIAALADQGQITLKPVMELEYMSLFRREEIQNTVSYICKTEFGADVLFSSDPGPDAKVLRLLKTGDRLHFEIDE